MKTSLKVLFLAAAIAAMPSCSAQRRAERHVRKAVELVPELVQVKAHAIDTTLPVPGFADCTSLSLFEVMSGDTLYRATDHGTFVVSMNPSTREVRLGFVAAPRQVRLIDTVHYSQVVFTPKTAVPAKAKHNVGWLIGGAVGFVVGCILMFYILFVKIAKIQE